jgi:aspartyl-tRNA(Asn)/glutamyl-tRNA(Gln) amidotransferase subunit A
MERPPMSDSGLRQLPLSELAARIERREVSPVAAVEASLRAIEELNPTLNAFRLVLAEQAFDAARAAEGEIVAGHYRGPLHGVPVAVKDLMDLRGTTTPAGSIVLADEVAAEDSEVVRLLRAAGAIIVGKTHMPEFAYSPASNNHHYGPVRNPWNLERDTGGSSSGSGAAVAAGLVWGATGSDTGGSIRMPGTLCGLVGLKPTHGRASARGAASLAWSLDHIGPMTRTVRDAALLLDAMAGHDPADNRTRRVPAGSYAANVEKDIVGLRVAVLTDDGGGQLGTPLVLEGVAAGIDALRAAGAVVSDLALPELAEMGLLNGVILNLEATSYYEGFLRERPADIGPWTRDRLLTAYTHSPLDYIKAQQVRAHYRRKVEALFEHYDLLALPGMPHDAPPLSVNQNNTRFTGPFNLLGWPAIVVPVGLGEHNCPVALQLVARPWRERTLLRAARTVERDGPWHGRLSPMLA